MKRRGQQDTDQQYRQTLRRLRGRIALSYLSILVERLARAFWPLGSLILALYAIAAFDGFSRLPDIFGKGALIAGLLAGVVLLGYGLWHFRPPTFAQALGRLDGTDPRRPLDALRDHMADGGADPLKVALWAQHRDYMAALAQALRPPAPRPDLPRRDPFALRLMALVLALAALLFAPLGFGNAVKQFAFPGRAVSPVDGISLEAWATPPPFTGLPAIYLPDVAEGQVTSVPKGTVLVVRVYGLGPRVNLQEGVSGRKTTLDAAQESLKTATFPVVQDGWVTIKAGRNLLADWRFAITPDAPPVVAFDGLPARGSAGEMALAFTATDDIAVQGGRATIRLDLDAVERVFGLAATPLARAPVVLDLPMPVSGGKRDISETLRADMSRHVWANLPVVITLQVTDGAGQKSAPVQMETLLPARVFFDPLAAAIVEQRRNILWSGKNDVEALEILRALIYAPDAAEIRAGHYLALRTLIYRFARLSKDGLSDVERAEIAEDLWNVAILLEDGPLGNARERLRRARDRLSQALEQGGDPQSLKRLEQELRQAIEDYLRALVQEAQQNDRQAQQDAPTLDDRLLQDMLDRMQQLMDQGQNAQAGQVLDQLGQMLENLQMSPGQSPSARRLQDLQDALKQQQDLADDTYRKLQDALRDGEISQQDLQDLADRQGALKDFLNRLAPQTEGEKMPLDGAQENMGKARDGLQEGDIGAALDEQAEALQNLREGIQKLVEDMQQQGQGDARRTGSDPLGRPLGQTGQSDTDGAMLNEQERRDRAQELLDEIRRRSGDRSRPEAEREYLNRLMDRF